MAADISQSLLPTPDDDVAELLGEASPARTAHSVNQASPKPASLLEGSTEQQGVVPLEEAPPPSTQSVMCASSTVAGVDPAGGTVAAQADSQPGLLAEKEAQTAWLQARYAELQAAAQALQQELAAAQAQCRMLEQQLAVSDQGLVVDQMLSQIDRLAAAKLEAECQADQRGREVEEAMAQLAAQQQETAKHRREVAALAEQLEAKAQALKSLGSSYQAREGELAALQAQMQQAATQAQHAASRAQAAAELEQQLRHKQAEAELASKHGAHMEQLMEQARSDLSSAQRSLAEERSRSERTASEAEQLRGQLAATTAEHQECMRHLGSSQRVIRELQSHLQALAVERDAATEQLQVVEERMEEADTKLRQARRAEVRPALLGGSMSCLGALGMRGLAGHARRRQSELGTGAVLS